MIRPSLFNSASRRAIGRNLALDLVVAVGMGVTMALVNAILPTVARRGGLEAPGLSALAAAPFVAHLFGAFASRFGPRNTLQLTLTRGIGSASLLLLFFVASPPVMVAVAVIFWLSLSFGGPFHLRRWGAMYPARLRGRVVGVLDPGAASSAIARADRAGPGLLRWRFIAAARLFALVHVDRLNLSLSDVGVIGILGAVVTTVAFPIWGVVADRSGPLTSLRIGSAIGLAALVGYNVAPSVGVLWLAAVAAGTASASIDVGIAAVVSDGTPLAARAAAMAGWNALTGARGIGAAFTMRALLQLGLGDVRAGLLLCAGDL